MSADFDADHLDLAIEPEPSPLQELNSRLLDDAGVRLFVKRDDLIHPHFGGNKWRKLRYNLKHARSEGYKTILTFGGAWSNHIYATAAAGKHFGFETIGLIRGEARSPLNTTLAFASDCGMQLHYIDRERYRQRNDDSFIEMIRSEFGDIYVLPEGGSNELAIKGCREIVHEIDSESEIAFDYICSACGTGATIAGIASAIAGNHSSKQQRAIGFSALKGGEFLRQEALAYLSHTAARESTAFDAGIIEDILSIETGYHFGGYARIDERLSTFMHAFEKQFGFTLDAVYTAKLFFGLFDMIRNARFKPGTCIVAIHSGGLQGNQGFDLETDSDGYALEL